MKTKIIYPPIEVFGDEKYCCGSSDLCVYVKNRFGYCELFREPLKISGDIKPEKCPQCKDLYKESRANKP